MDLFTPTPITARAATSPASIPLPRTFSNLTVIYTKFLSLSLSLSVFYLLSIM
jgi:hypothetical protein